MKAGYKTTEFWAVIALNVGVLAAAIGDVLPPRYAAISAAVSVFGYNVARGLAKVVPPKDSA
jgi:hypothetical protein